MNCVLVHYRGSRLGPSCIQAATSPELERGGIFMSSLPGQWLRPWQLRAIIPLKAGYRGSWSSEQECLASFDQHHIIKFLILKHKHAGASSNCGQSSHLAGYRGSWWSEQECLAGFAQHLIIKFFAEILKKKLIYFETQTCRGTSSKHRQSSHLAIEEASWPIAQS